MNNDSVNKHVASTADERVVNNTMRHKYRVLSEAEKGHVEAVKDLGEGFMSLLSKIEQATPGTPYGREFALARTKMEEAVFWAVKGLAK